MLTTSLKNLAPSLFSKRQVDQPRLDEPGDERALIRQKIAASGMFDEAFYVRRHPEAELHGATPLDHFVDVGLAAGHAPSPRFHPQAYLETYPDAVALGMPAVLHYIEHGRAEGRVAPTERALIRQRIVASGLFDEAFYAARHPEGERKGATPLDHFVDVGLAAGHAPSPRFNPKIYLEIYPDVVASGMPAVLHYIQHGRAEGRVMPTDHALVRHRIMASGLFDAAFYAERYPEAARDSDDPLDHYLNVGAAKGYRPSVEFDVKRYLAAHPDLAVSGIDPLKHYIASGREEGRKLPTVPFDREGLDVARERIAASGLFDADFYLRSNPVLRDQGGDPILHYLLEGAFAHQEVSPDFSLKAYAAQHPEIVDREANPLLHYLDHKDFAEPLPPDLSAVREPWNPGEHRSAYQEEMLERMAAASFFDRFGFSFESSGPIAYLPEAAAELAARRPALRLDASEPDVSIIIPVYGQMPFVLSCLDSLSLHASRFSVEIIVSDDVSPDRFRTDLLRSIPWIRYEKRPSNVGFLKNCNQAAASARGRHVVLLNSDTRLLHGWLDELIGSFDLFPKAGFVGSKLINPDGTLQEAGGVYWADGTAWNYGRNMDPLHPAYSFARQVDWVSGAAIAVPSAVWREMGGFDEAYSPAYCEDVDLAFRIRERGYEVWYQPMSRVLHFEGMTHGRDEKSGVKAYQVTNLKRLKARWGDKLKGKRPGGHQPDLEADRSATRKMLVIDANVHMPDRDAGSLVGSYQMQAYRELGYRQTFVPLHGFAYQHRYTQAYQRLGVKMLYAPFYNGISDVLKDGIEYDYVFITRYNVAQDILDEIRRAMPMARIIFCNADLHFLRTAREAALTGDRTRKVLASRVETDELGVFARVDCSLVHTPDEREAVETRMPSPLGNILTFPWVSTIDRATAGFEPRRDLMFLGGFPHTPNVDAMVYFMEEIWPRLRDRLPADARMLIVGNSPPAEIKAFASDRVEVTGFVPQVEPLLARARVFVVPLRFGAGIKGKLIESMANGVPSVATSIAAEGIGLADGGECRIADDPDAFAEAVLSLYNEPDAWRSIREAGYRLVERNYSWETAMKICERSLDVADETWIERETRARAVRLREIFASNAAGG